MHFRIATMAAAPVVAALLLQAGAGTLARATTLPESLSGREFWALIERLSEPDGFFRSNSGSPDNLLSNEISVSTAAAALARRVSPGGVYLGVGPEQNFTYIAAMRPRIAFITDIRRGNLHLHLMYKALFGMHANRADFLARLFSRERPSGLATNAPAAQLMDAYLDAAPLDAGGFAANLAAILAHLRMTDELPIDAADAEGIAYVYRNFHEFGPAIHYTSSIGGRPASSYARIVSSTDAMSGSERSFLATEANFRFVKGLQARNLIVPVVGNFAGPKAIRAIGEYLRSHEASVTAFYVSNVEDYLSRAGVWPAFCANVATLPLTQASVFIRPSGRQSAGMFSTMAAESRSCDRPPMRPRRR
jgi:hypothetical protein